MMQNNETMQTGGNLKISRDVIGTIARYAALEIDGVDSLASLTNNLKGWLLNTRQPVLPITIELNDGVAEISLRVNIKAGTRIPELAERVQAAVKEAVQNMTGIAVSCVNVDIAGIVFEEQGASEAAHS